jgi:hypothetical protein
MESGNPLNKCHLHYAALLPTPPLVESAAISA